MLFRSREILADIARRPMGGRTGVPEELTLAALLQEVASRFERPGIEVQIETTPRDSSKAPVTGRQPELMHGLGNLVQNAIQFAAHRVFLLGEWNHREVTVTISDDGPGVPPAILARLGEPYVSGRHRRTNAGTEGHLGLGVFIAVSLLAHVGGKVRFGKPGKRGTQVVITFDRRRFEKWN